ncbi:MULTISPECIES: hypothetical protein [unclassified Lysinibacillus]
MVRIIDLIDDFKMNQVIIGRATEIESVKVNYIKKYIQYRQHLVETTLQA